MVLDQCGPRFRHASMNYSLRTILLLPYLLMPSAYFSYYFSLLATAWFDNVLPCLFENLRLPEIFTLSEINSWAAVKCGVLL